MRAFDGIYDDFATVEIKIENVNDNRPVFLPFNKNVTIEEESLVEGCIAKVRTRRTSEKHTAKFNMNFGTNFP